MRLKEILAIVKPEFHSLFSNLIKRKRQVQEEPEQGEAVKASNIVFKGLKLEESDDEEEVVVETNFNQVHDYDEGEEYIPRSHFSKAHWARATTETMIKVEDLDDPIVALVDSGSEINIMSKSLFLQGNWPVDMDHGWRVKAANTAPGDLYGACPNLRVTIGDVSEVQNFFIQEHLSYTLILGQPFIVATRMETKVLDDGLAYARIRSKDGKKAVQFLTVCVNHNRNRDSLRKHPLPQATKEFKEFRDFSGFSKSTIVKRDYDGTCQEGISPVNGVQEIFSFGFIL